MAEKGKLVPVAGAQPTYQLIPFGQLKLSDGPRPDANLVESIRSWGVFEDLLVRPWRNQFSVIAGRRRALAVSRIATEDDRDPAEELLPCKVITDPEAALAAMVATNNIGKRNPLADCDAIVKLTGRYIKEGLGPVEITKRITKELRLTAGTQKKRLKLRYLPTEVRFAICEGNVAVSTAEHFEALSKDQRAELLAKLEETGKITAADLKATRQTGIVRTVESMKLFTRLPNVPELDTLAQQDKS